MQLKSCNLFQVIAYGNINHLLQQPNMALKRDGRYRALPLALR